MQDPTTDPADAFLREVLRWYGDRKERWHRLGTVANNVAGDFNRLLEIVKETDPEIFERIDSTQDDLASMRIILWTTEVRTVLTDCMVFASCINEVTSGRRRRLLADPEGVWDRLDSRVEGLEEKGLGQLLDELSRETGRDCISPEDRDALLGAAAVRNLLIHTVGRVNRRNGPALPWYRVGDYVEPTEEWDRFKPACDRIIPGFKRAVEALREEKLPGGSPGGSIQGPQID